MTNESTRIRKRLIRCFREFFGDTLPDDVSEAKSENVAGWDSMATWTLLMLVEEQFEIKIGLDQIPKLTSFAAFENHIQSKLS